MQFSFNKPTAASEPNGKRKNVGALRRSHLLMSYGPGALVDLPDVSVVMGACDYWEKTSVIREPRLEAMLGVRKFRAPAASEDLYKSPGVVRAMRFPYWHYCSKCGRLGPYWTIGGGKDQMRCAVQTCNGELLPSRFVAACERGHIEDFPYEFWVHHAAPGGQFSCPAKKSAHPRMRISFSSKGDGLESIRVTCLDCEASRTMANATAKGAVNPRYCLGLRPWVGNRKDDNEPDGCGQELRALQRGASNVYFPITHSALTIPMGRSRLLNELYDQVARAVARKGGDRDEAIEYLAVKFDEELEDAGMTAEELFDEYAEASEGEKVAVRTRDILEGEYRALCSPDSDEADFKTEHVGVPRGYGGLIRDVVLVRRLKEVLALSGFTRVTPGDSGTEEFEPMPPFASKKDWLPAMELRGEGVFITLDQTALDEWAARVGARYEPMRRRVQGNAKARCTNFSPQLVVLHTFAHALIRQLTVECGYSGSSLKERIYSSWPDSKQGMAGILVFTSASDSDGSLGGLVRQGAPERLGETIRQALENASWCSSDPVCSESTAQGYESLNYAACHACTLLPETSCALRNCMLDRVAVTGTLEDPELGFFGKWMEEAADRA